MSDYWDGPVYDDVNREAYAHWLAERPQPDAPDYHEPSPYDWPFRQVNNDPDPWAIPQIQCARCEEFHELGCTHGLELCAGCAGFGCQSCACEEADAAAIIQQQQDEWWGRA